MNLKLRWLAFPLLLAASAAQAEDTSARVIKFPDIEWAKAAGPRDAQGNQVPSRAVVRCRVSAGGILSDCRTIKETPQGSGAGAALIAAAPRYVVEPATRGGLPVESEMSLVVDWFDVDTRPELARKIQPGDLLAVFPREALLNGVSGRGRINCLISVQGVPYDCEPLGEDPPGSGFAQAVMAIAPQLVFKPAIKAGRPVVAPANVPIRFEAPPRGSLPQGSTFRMLPTTVVWPEAPSVADVAAAYPAKARSGRVAGRVTLICDVTDDGRLRACRSIAEAPKGLGFAAAANKLAQQFRLPQPPAGENLRNTRIQLAVTFEPTILDGGAPIVRKPQWAKTPTAEEMKAALAGVPPTTGSVRLVMDCLVEAGGSLGDCKIDGPSPQGLADAALKLAPTFRVATWSEEGLPLLGGRVKVPLRFDIDPPLITPDTTTR